jgi:hypothetical protein
MDNHHLDRDDPPAEAIGARQIRDASNGSEMKLVHVMRLLYGFRCKLGPVPAWLLVAALLIA